MICAMCGIENEDGFAFCMGCGYPLRPHDSQAPAFDEQGQDFAQPAPYAQAAQPAQPAQYASYAQPVQPVQAPQYAQPAQPLPPYQPLRNAQPSPAPADNGFVGTAYPNPTRVASAIAQGAPVASFSNDPAALAPNPAAAASNAAGASAPRAGWGGAQPKKKLVLVRADGFEFTPFAEGEDLFTATTDTRVGGSVLSKGESVHLKAGDTITLSGTEFVVEER